MNKQLFLILLLNATIYGIPKQAQAPGFAQPSLQQQIHNLDNEICCKDALSIAPAAITFLSCAYVWLRYDYYDDGARKACGLAGAIGTMSAIAYSKLQKQKSQLQMQLNQLKDQQQKMD